MHHAAAHVVGATVEACRQVLERRGAATAPTSPAACTTRCADRASGFCIYNDVAVGIQCLLDQGAERVAYVDVDVHHGDGVEQIFWDDPRVLTISLHETGQMLFPGTGFPTTAAGPDAEGTRGQRRAPAGHGRRGLAAGLPRGRAAAAARVRARTCWSPSTAATPTSRTRSPT